MLALLFQLLLGTNCRVEQPDYANLDHYYVAIAKVPSFFGHFCAGPAGASIDVFADASTRHKIAEVRWGTVDEGGGADCQVLVFEPRQLCPRGTLPSMQDTNEETAFVVLERNGNWVRVRLDRGSGWVHLTKKDEVVTYGDLVSGRLAAFTEAWDGTIYDSPGGTVRRLTADKQEVTVDDWREEQGRLWLQVRVLAQSPCEARDPEVIAKGWVHAYSNKKQPVVAHYPGGC